MQIIDNSIINDNYDVIIVGAGNGGINAAALLGKMGYKVLVIEQHYMPGGCCTSIRRKGIAFDVAAAMLFGFNPETGYKPHVYVMNELEEDINMILHESMYRMHIRANDELKKITFWRDFDKFFAELTTAFPHQKTELTNLYKDFMKTYDTLVMGIGALYAPSIKDWKKILPKAMKHIFGVLSMVANLDRSIQELLDKYGITDPNLQGMFDFLIATFFTTTCKETPALMGPILFIDAHKGGACYPVGSPQMLPNKLEKAIEKFGGQMIYRHLVEEVLIDPSHKRAIGVRLDDGTVIKSKYVISDATIWNFYGKLIKPEHFKPAKIEWAQKFVPTLSIFILYVGVKAEVIPKDFHSIMVWIEDPSNFAAPNKTFFAFIPSIDDPSIAPKGYHSMSILCPGTNRDWPTLNNPDYRSESYKKIKEEEAWKVLECMEKYIPNLRKNVVTLEAGTAGTVERFTLKNWGCVAGPKQMIGQHMFKRPGADTDFENVFMVGDLCTFGEGVVSTCSSGISAVNSILKLNKQKTFEVKEHKKQFVHLVKGEQRIDYPKVNETLDAAKAQRLSMECNWCENANSKRCMKTCPAGIDVLNFIRRIEVGNYIGAAKAIREMNPLGEICGIICPGEKLCQKDCYHQEYEKGPVEIPRLQAWACKQAGKDGFFTEPPTSNGKKVAIIGAGPAGLSCANFLARLGYKVDIFDKRNKKGGMITHVIPTFRLSEEIIDRELNGISLPSINFIYGKELGKDFTVTQLAKDYEAVFLAPGLWAGKGLTLPGSENVNSIDALSFISEFRTDGKVNVKSNVLVIGGGSVAMDAAETAKKAGAKKVTLVCLESEGEMPCLKSESAACKDEGIEIINCWGPKEFKNASTLTFISCTKVYDEKGKFCPEFKESESLDISFDQVIFAVGQVIEPALGSYFEKEFGSKNLKVDETSQLVVGQKNIYAGGDIIRGAGTVVQSVADGRRAAFAIHKNLIPL